MIRECHCDASQNEAPRLLTVTGGRIDSVNRCRSDTGWFVDSRPSMWSGTDFPQLEPVRATVVSVFVHLAVVAILNEQLAMHLRHRYDPRPEISGRRRVSVCVV